MLPGAAVHPSGLGVANDILERTHIVLVVGLALNGVHCLWESGLECEWDSVQCLPSLSNAHSLPPLVACLVHREDVDPEEGPYRIHIFPRTQALDSGRQLPEDCRPRVRDEDVSLSGLGSGIGFKLALVLDLGSRASN